MYILNKNNIFNLIKNKILNYIYLIAEICYRNKLKPKNAKIKLKY